MRTIFWATQAALGVLFVGLRLTGFIDWHWALVTAPLWLGAVIVWGLIGILEGILWCLETPEQRRIRKNREFVESVLGWKLP